MSHVVVIETEVRDVESLQAACARLRLPAAREGVHRLFQSSVAGWAVELPGWRYPVVCDVAGGRLHYDDYEGRWGRREELGRWLQAYAVERARLEARRKGHSVLERTLADGSIQLTVQVGG